VVNRAPLVAADPARTTRPGQPLSVDGAALLANDTDADGDALSIARFGALTPGGGTVTSPAPGTFVYTPAPGFVGTDRFEYAVADGYGGEAAGYLEIEVVREQRAPVARDDFLVVAEDGSGRIRLLANDSDPDGDALAVAIVAGPSYGVLVAEDDGWYRYTPAPDFNGADEVTYRVSDGQRTATAKLFVTVTPVNDPPVFTSTPPTTLTLEGHAACAGEGGVFVAPGERGAVVKIAFEWLFREAAYDNEVGIYRVDDLRGTVAGVAPDEDGYARAALAAGRAQVIFASGERAGAKRELVLEGGGLYALYLVQDGTTARFLRENPANVPGCGRLAFFSVVEANPDGFDHLRLTRTGASGLELAWEDLTGGGDRDFNDVVFRAGLALPERRGLFVYDADATDVDGDTLTFSLAEAPEGARIDPVTGLLTWLPEAPGVYRFVVRVHDGNGGVALQSFDVDVAARERVLYVKGTEGNDQIEITEADGRIRVKVNREERIYTGITGIVVDARGGNDVVRLSGLTIGAIVEGGSGNDKLDASGVVRAKVELRGGDGNDTLIGGALGDRLLGGNGNDTIRGGGGDDWIEGGAGDDALFGDEGDDVLLGGAGADTLKGGSGDDVLGRDSPHDRVDGQAGCDRVVNEAAFLADPLQKRLAAASAGPVIDFSASLRCDDSRRTSRSSWVEDFVLRAAKRPHEYDPNGAFRLKCAR
ncbi:MAG: Ig-like domain-containing protein, partial [Burkholderiales bacterium]|nr:Ig-like domain-containing protein [Burkholderiales bacterium]